MWRKGTLCTAGGTVNWCSHYGKIVCRFLKKTENRTTMWSSNSTSGYLLEESKSTNSKRYVHCSIIYNSQDTEATKLPINTWRDKDNEACVCVCVCVCVILICHKNKILPLAAKRMDLESIVLSAVSQRKTNNISSHLHVECKTETNMPSS